MVRSVYISYAEEDAMYASLLGNALKEHKIKTIEFSYEADYNFQPEFQHKLKRIDYFIPIVSSFWKKNLRAQMEYGAVAAQSKNILPVILENNETGLPIKLNHFIKASKINVTEVARKIAVDKFDTKKQSASKNIVWGESMYADDVIKVWREGMKSELSTIKPLGKRAFISYLPNIDSSKKQEPFSAKDILAMENMGVSDMIDIIQAEMSIEDRIKCSVVKYPNKRNNTFLFACNYDNLTDADRKKLIEKFKAIGIGDAGFVSKP